MGMESVYWGIPSLLLGNSLYDRIRSTINITYDSFELNAYLKSPSSWSCNPHSALPYGYFMSVFGVEFEYYSPCSATSGNFLVRIYTNID
jgi:hypothetical protein